MVHCHWFPVLCNPPLHRYTVVRRHELLPQEDSPPALPRELAALVRAACAAALVA